MRSRMMFVALLVLAMVPSVAAAQSKPRTPSAAARSAAAARTLDATHIEGEIPVPQVLFITARDQRRFMEFQHRRYLRSSLQIGKDAALPSWIVVTHGSESALKEAVR